MAAQYQYGTSYSEPVTDTAKVDEEPQGCQHEIDGLKVLCDQPDCGGFALFDMKYRGRPLVMKASFLITSCFIIIVLFRVTGLVWPMYTFVGLGLIFLIAAVLSRGRALLAATGVLVGFAIIWAIYAASNNYLHGISSFIGRIGAAWSLVLAVVLGLCSLLAFILGKTTAVDKLKETSGYFLATGVFIVGFWAIWSILLQNGLASHVAFEAVLTVSVVVPLPFIVHLLVQGEFDSKGSQFALAFALVSAYVSVTSMLVNGLAYVLGTLFPRILGAAPLPTPSLPWLNVLGWRNLVGSLLLVSALVIISATSWSQAFEAFRASRSHAAGAGGSQPAASSASNALLAIPILVQRLVGQAARYALAFGDFLVKFLFRFARNLKTIFTNLFSYVLKLLRHLIVPIMAFTLVSMFALLLLGELRTYDVAGSEYRPQALWGALVTLLSLAVLFFGAAFGLATTGEERGNWQELILTVTTNAGLAGFMLYYLVSIVSLGLIPLSFTLRSNGVNLHGIAPGPLYYTNLVAVAILSVAALMLAVAQHLLRGRSGAERIQTVLAVVLIVGFVTTAAYLGFEPLRHATDLALNGTFGHA